MSDSFDVPAGCGRDLELGDLGVVGGLGVLGGL